MVVAPKTPDAETLIEVRNVVARKATGATGKRAQVSVLCIVSCMAFSLQFYTLCSAE